MIFNKKYDYPEISRVTNDDGTRFYTCRYTGAQLPSITTIISATSPKKQFLEEWAEFVGAKKANRIKTEATNLGTLMHTHLECHIQGLERPKGTHPVRMMAARMADKVIEAGLTDVDEVHGIEAALAFPGLFAGTTDLIGLFKGRPAIMDFKTAGKMRTRDMIADDYGAQLGAYALAHDEIYGTDIRTGVIFMVARDLQFQSFVFEGSEFQRSKMSFLERYETYITQTAA